MGLEVTFPQGKLPADAAEWARAFRQTPVKPSAASVTPTELASSTTDLIEATAQTAADAAQVAATASATVLAGSAQTGAEATAAAGLAAHVAAPDPHPGYTTAAELASAIAAHEAASDPHPGYLTQTEGDARYLQLTLTLVNAVDDAAAAGGGVAVGHLYRNGSVVMIRVV